jgi:uncharacterized protein (DUF433 family)
MTRTEILARIAIDANVCSGRPAIRGHRIEVATILELLSNGWSSSEIVAKYPGLTESDIDACIAYSGETTWERDIVS